jgi:hypothetical protein
MLAKKLPVWKKSTFSKNFDSLGLIKKFTTKCVLMSSNFGQYPIIEWGNQINWPHVDLPALQIPGREVDNVSQVQIFFKSNERFLMILIPILLFDSCTVWAMLWNVCLDCHIWSKIENGTVFRKKGQCICGG